MAICFFTIKTAANLRNMFLYMLGVSWAVPKTTKGILGLLERDWKKRNGGRLVGTDSCKHLVDSVEGGNSRCFEDKSNNICKTKKNYFSLLYFLSKQDIVSGFALWDVSVHPHYSLDDESFWKRYSYPFIEKQIRSSCRGC